MSVTQTLEQQKRDRFLSRASSRKELASTVHDLLIPTIQSLQHNDKVSQEAIKAIVEGTNALVTQVETEAKRLRAFEAQTFVQRLRWIFRGMV